MKQSKTNSIFQEMLDTVNCAKLELFQNKKEENVTDYDIVLLDRFVISEYYNKLLIIMDNDISIENINLIRNDVKNMKKHLKMYKRLFQQNEFKVLYVNHSKKIDFVLDLLNTHIKKKRRRLWIL